MKRGIAIVSCPSVRQSVRNVDVSRPYNKKVANELFLDPNVDESVPRKPREILGKMYRPWHTSVTCL